MSLPNIVPIILSTTLITNMYAGVTQANIDNINFAQAEIQKTQDMNLVQTSKQQIEPDIFYGYENVSEDRKAVVNLAISIQGIPKYQWGSKYYNLKNMDSIDSTDAFDCSGFVQWVYLKSLNIDIGEGTLYISKNAQEIKYEDLQPGDLGLKFNGGSYYIDCNGNITTEIDKDNDGNIDDDISLIANHIGIYVGKDENGNDLWCHCNKKDNTVSVNNYSGFNYYCSVFK